MNTKKPNLIDKFKARPKSQQIFIIVGIIILASILGQAEKNNSSTYSKSNSSAENCNGNESCISKVRENFSNTGKTILEEEYLGNGKFSISFIDSQHPDAYNATVTTDCNCNLIDVNVTTIR